MIDKTQKKSIHSRSGDKLAQYQVPPNHIYKQRELSQQQANHHHDNYDQGDCTMYQGGRTSESKIELSRKVSQIHCTNNILIYS